MFAVLHVADFPLQAVLRIERDLAGKIVALLDETQRPPVVVACTENAATLGLGPGVTAPQAMARCAEVILKIRQPDAEAEAQAVLWATAFSISPQVEATAPGMCTIFVGGVADESREPVLRKAVAQLRELGLEATAGLAATPLLALYAARHAHALQVACPRCSRADPSGRGDGATTERTAGLHEERARLLGGAPESADARGEFGKANSPVLPGFDDYVQDENTAGYSAEVNESALDDDGRNARDLEKRTTRRSSLHLKEEPEKVFRIDNQRSFLSGLSIAVAEPSAEIAAILASWGVRTLGQLTALTKADVTQRLGPEGLALWERAAGEVTRPLRLIVAQPTFSAELELEHEIETLEPLLFVLRRFIDRLSLELENAGFVAGEMILRLMLADETEHTREFRLPEPTAHPEILFRVLHAYLETLHTEAMVHGLGLTCRPVRPLSQQSGLFESALRDPHGFSETLARVATVVGPDRIGTPVLENTHRPDAVTLMKPAAVVPPMMKASVHPRQGLPLRRYRPAWPATVELNGTAPTFVWTGVMAGAVLSARGPWRGSGEWWDATREWRREEWDVELETGGVYRLLHLPEGWFVEGEYD